MDLLDWWYCAALALAVLAAISYWLWRRRRAAAVHDPYLEAMRWQAEAAFAFLNKTVSAFDFIADTTDLLERAASVIERLGDRDAASAIVAHKEWRSELTAVLTAYYELAAGRTCDTGALVLHGAMKQKGSTATDYDDLAERVHGLSQRILNVLPLRENLRVFCDETESAIAMSATRVDELRARATLLLASLHELTTAGYEIRLDRQKISTARGHLTQATTAIDQSNYRTALRCLDAASNNLDTAEAATQNLPAKRQAIAEKLVTFAAQINEAPTELKAAQDRLKRLRRRYNTTALAVASAEITTARLAIKNFAVQMATARTHYERYEVHEAEMIVAALDAVLGQIRETPGFVRAHQGTLEHAAREFDEVANVVSSELEELSTRSRAQHNRRRVMSRLAALERGIAEAHAHVRADPVAALTKIKEVAAAVTQLEAHLAVEDLVTES